MWRFFLGLPIDLFRLWWWLVSKPLVGLWRMLRWTLPRLEPLVDAALVFALERLAQFGSGVLLLVVLAASAAMSALAGIWRAFRWLVLAPGLWKSSEPPDTLMVVRAVATAVVGFVVGLWIEWPAAGNSIAPALGAGVCLGAVGAFLMVFVTLIQLMAQDAIHGE